MPGKIPEAVTIAVLDDLEPIARQTALTFPVVEAALEKALLGEDQRALDVKSAEMIGLLTIMNDTTMKLHTSEKWRCLAAEGLLALLAAALDETRSGTNAYHAALAERAREFVGERAAMALAAGPERCWKCGAEPGAACRLATVTGQCGRLVDQAGLRRVPNSAPGAAGEDLATSMRRVESGE